MALSLSLVLRLKLERQLAIATVRMVVQLVLVGYVLTFLFAVVSPSWTALAAFIMVIFASREIVLRHDDFTVYETSAIASYVDDAFAGPRLTPQDVQGRARMNQWISAVNSYHYPYMIYHVTHERLVFPALGIASDER